MRHFRGAAFSLLLAMHGGSVTGLPEASTGALTLVGRYPFEEVTSTTRDTYTVEYLRGQTNLVPEVLARVDMARRAVARAAKDAFLMRIDILVAPDTEAFVAMVGAWAENSSAVARPSSRQVVINADSVRTAGTEALGPLLVHEFAHLYVGVEVPGRLPRWMDEGIAMMIAGEWDTEDAAAMALAGLSKTFRPLRDLQGAFPADESGQRAAYRQSFSVVRHVVDSRYQGSLALLLQDLKSTGPSGWWDPVMRQGLEADWRRSHEGWASVFLVTLHSGLLWWVVAGLTVLGAVLVRLRRRRRWAEEALAEAQEGGETPGEPEPGRRVHVPPEPWHRPSARD